MITTHADLSKLNYIYNGGPFANLAASLVDTTGMDYFYNGGVFYAPENTNVPAGPTYNAAQFFAMF